MIIIRSNKPLLAMASAWPGQSCSLPASRFRGQERQRAGSIFKLDQPSFIGPGGPGSHCLALKTALVSFHGSMESHTLQLWPLHT